MKQRIREELLHYIWKVRAFDLNHLKSEQGEKLEIISWGNYNRDAGPDFLNGKVRVGDTVWAGHIEMHLRASDWRRHKHSDDPQYQNVVLHVVYHADEDVRRSNGSIIPSLSLESRIHPDLLAVYDELLNNQNWIPCQDHISGASPLIINSTIERQVASRLDEKAIGLQKELDELDGDLGTLILYQLAWAFGLRVNGEAMKLLIRSFPPAIIFKHRDHLLQLEALLFGQAGLIPEEKDDYIISLSQEYEFLKSKFLLTPISSNHWKYHRLRPAAFPTIRIAQFCKLLHSVDRLDLLLLEGSKDEILNALIVKADGYWKYHYTWQTPSTPRVKALGKSKREVILINTVVPVLWFYGQLRSDERLKEKALLLMESIKAEKNSIITKWNTLGITSHSAFDTQGLLHLKKHLCDHQKCLECPIGHSILIDNRGDA